MRISNKIHRGARIAAAVVLLVTLLLSVASNTLTMVNNVRNDNTASLISTLINLSFNVINGILLVAALFRGKKDNLAAGLVLTTALLILGKDVTTGLISMVSYASSRALYPEDVYGCMAAAAAIRLVAAVFNVAFRVFLGLECLKPGSISSRLKSVPGILSVVYVMLSSASIVAQLFYTITRSSLSTLLSVLGPVLLSASITAVLNIGSVMAALAFSLPVYEETPAGYGYNPEPRYNHY